jgi:formate hydrogenlyase subunit 4
MTIAFFVLLWLFINLMILFIMNSVEEQTSPLDFFVEMIAVIVSPILWITFWTVVNRIRKTHRKRKKVKETKESEPRC